MLVGSRQGGSGTCAMMRSMVTSPCSASTAAPRRGYTPSARQRHPPPPPPLLLLLVPDASVVAAVVDGAGVGAANGASSPYEYDGEVPAAVDGWRAGLGSACAADQAIVAVLGLPMEWLELDRPPGVTSTE